MRKTLLLFCAAVIAVSASATEGALSGKFTINAQGDQIQFAKGNLQYQASTGTWQFAAHQYTIIGEDNANIADDYTGWIDLFGWGTGNRPTFTSDENSAYITFVDWGTNAISNGGNTPNMWRTLTKDEWTYLHSVRLVDQAASRRGNGVVNEMYGWILLPDDWELPDGLSFESGMHSSWAVNNYTEQQWEAMEAAGAVFLPAGGQRQEGYLNYVAEEGFYWHATLEDDEGYAWQFSFNGNASSTGSSDCAFGSSVRLVYVVPAETATENTEIIKKATKRIVGGQFLIELNGRTYNALGIEIK